jgi:hypothetical protein
MSYPHLPVLSASKPAQALLEWRAHNCSVGLFYEPQPGLEVRWTGKGGHPRSQRVELATTAPYLGGRRHWFVCPVTGARCRTPYLVKGRCISRQAFRGAYPSQRISTAKRRARE